MDELISRNLDSLYANQADRLQKQLVQPSPIESAAYQGMDNGVHTAIAVDGSVIRGGMQTNGAVALGSMVSVYAPEGGAAFMDAMPR